MGDLERSSCLSTFCCLAKESAERAHRDSVVFDFELILLFASLLTIPLARQSSFDAALLTGLEVVGVTFNFLDDVFLLYLPLKPAQSVFERFAFLNANLCQRGPTSKPAKGAWNMILEKLDFWAKGSRNPLLRIF